MLSNKKPLAIAASVFVASIAWGIVCALYNLYTHAGNSDRFWGADIVLLVLALINRLSKVSAPIAQIVFTTWWIHDPRAEIIALGMLCGVGFGTIGGVYFIARGVGRGYQAHKYPEPIDNTLHRTGQVYIVGSFLAVGLACWYIFKLGGFLSDSGAVEAALLSAGISCLGTLSIFAFLAWLAFWGAVAGQQLFLSLGGFK